MEEDEGFNQIMVFGKNMKDIKAKWTTHLAPSESTILSENYRRSGWWWFFGGEVQEEESAHLDAKLRPAMRQIVKALRAEIDNEGDESEGQGMEVCLLEKMKSKYVETLSLD